MNGYFVGKPKRVHTSYNKKEIRLSKWYVELNDLISVRDTNMRLPMLYLMSIMDQTLVMVSYGKIFVGKLEQSQRLAVKRI